MRHRHGAAFRNLLFEQGNHAAIAAEHVAEAHRREHGLRRTRIVLHDHLAHALGGAHDRSGVHGLVGRDEREVLHAEGVRRAHHVQRAEDVVLDCLARAYLHKRHVLVGGRVEHHRWVILLEHLVHARLVADAADLNVDRDVVVGAKQFLAKHVGVVLADVEDDDAARRDLRQLAAQLTADRAAAARDKHGLARNVRIRDAHVELHFLAP